jgi:hypothetical protein
MVQTVTKWIRVSKRRPCPICGKPDWCMYAGPADAPAAVICQRVESQRRCGEAGHLHILRDTGPTWSPSVRRIELSARRQCESSIDFGKLANDFRAAVVPGALDKLAQSLGVSTQSLHRLGVGWAAQHNAWAFPMQTAAGAVVGIRLRRPDGRKLSIRGGHEGLFIPDNIGGGQLYITEGASDCAALLDLGFSAVGRPSCSGGVKLLVDLVQRLRPAQVAIVADADKPGQDGADRLASVLAAYCVDVRIITPPAGVKDVREWKRSGATAVDIQRAVDAAPVRKLAVAVRIKKGYQHGK